MKTKYIILLGISAIVTLSFTVISTTKPEVSKVEIQKIEPASAPVGGIVLDDSF